MTGDWLLLLGCTEQQAPVVDAAHRRGLAVLGLDPDPSAHAAALVDRFVVADLADVETCLSVARAARPLGVVTFAADFPVPMVARIANSLGLVGPSIATAEAMTDKLVMRRRLAAAGVPVPRFTEAGGTGCTIGPGPVVVKPAVSSGSRGVTLVDSIDDRRSLGRAVEQAAGHSANGTVLIEDYVDGPEVSVEAMSLDGDATILAVTDKETSGPPQFVEVGHSQPTTHDPATVAAISRTTREALAALGLQHGPSHTEIRLGAAGPVVIESAARFGGGLICSHLLRLTRGIDGADAAVASALGCAETAAGDAGDAGEAAAVRFLRPAPGLVRSVDGLAAARATSGVVEAEVAVGPGDRVNPLRSARDRVGHVVATASTPAEAQNRARTAAELIEISTEPGSDPTSPDDRGR